MPNISIVITVHGIGYYTIPFTDALKEKVDTYARTKHFMFTEKDLESGTFYKVPCEDCITFSCNLACVCIYDNLRIYCE